MLLMSTSQQNDPFSVSNENDESNDMEERKHNVITSNSNMIGLASRIYLPLPWNIGSILTLLIQWLLLGALSSELFVSIIIDSSILEERHHDGWCPNDASSGSGGRVFIVFIAPCFLLLSCCFYKLVCV